MIKTRILPALLAAALATPALGAGGAGKVTDVDFSFEGPFGTYDAMQLQRGYQVYEAVCSGCHGLKFVPFRELGRSDGPNFPEDQVKAIAAQYEVADENGEPGDTRPGKPSDNFPEVTSAGAPDLSLMAKARAGFHGPMGLGLNQFLNGIGGPEYIYSLLTSYTGEEVEVAGAFLYKNEAYPGGLISMAQPLYGEDVDYAIYDENGQITDDHGGYVPPEPTMEQIAEDVSAFLKWTAEPTLVERKSAGLRNLVFVIFLAVLLFYTNKALWAPIKRKDA